MKSNVSVGPPLDVFAYEKDSFAVEFRMRLNEDDPYIKELQERWSAGIARLVGDMPTIHFPDTERLPGSREGR